jgi:hypothetical protein
MKFQKRDKYIVQTIYSHDGVVAKRHLKMLFWPGKTQRAMEQRLAVLHHERYIDWPTLEQRRTKPIPEPICWLGWRGAIYMAGILGVDVQPPTSENENQKRLLQKILRKQGINWVREPRWSLLAHDLVVTDFRLAVQKSVDEIQQLSLKRWVTESTFRSQTDVVIYEYLSRKRRKGVCPDGYFEIVDEKRKSQGLPHKARFLLEIDMATHDNPSFGREKILPGVAYIKSREYKTRFGCNNGHWLIVTSGKRRMQNLIDQTKEKAKQDASIFFFTTLDELNSGNVMTSLLWWQETKDKPTSLITM